MNPLSAVVPLIGGVISASADQASGMTSARMARTAYRHRYQDTVQDMRKAGLNPALAYGQGGGPGAQGQSIPELGSSFARGATAASNARQSLAAADLTNAQAALLKMQTTDLAEQVAIRNDLMEAQIGQTGATTALTTRRRDQIAVATMRARLDYQWASATQADRIAIVNKELRRMGLQGDKLEIENELLRLQKPEAQATAEFFRGAGKYSPYINTANDILRTLMPKINIGGKELPPTRRRIGR